MPLQNLGSLQLKGTNILKILKDVSKLFKFSQLIVRKKSTSNNYVCSVTKHKYKSNCDNFSSLMEIIEIVKNI